VTGVASATLAATVTVVDSTDTSSYIAMFDSATGSLAAKTDAGITYNAGTGMLTATGFTGPLTGTLQTASQTNITAVGTIATGVWQGTAIASGYIAADAITGAKIADNAIDSEHYTDGSIDNAHIADNAIDSEHYADGSIDNAHIADDAIDSEHYAAASIDFAHIQNVAANSILGRNADSSGVLSEVALTTTQILIGDGTGFTAAALSSDVTMTNAGAVTIANNAVTLAKMAGGTDGQIITYDASGDPVAVGPGSDGQVLTSTGAGSPPAFEAIPTAGTASVITVADSSNTSASVAFFESATGDLGPKTDSGLTYNAGTGVLTATGFAGPLTGTATVATAVTITDNENDDEDNAIIFAAGGDVDGGNLGLESDGTLTYNPSTGKVTATGFIGTLAGAVTGNVTGNTSGSSGSTTGNAATATALATGRTIGGVSFDGTANIAVTLAATATALASARTINGVSFDGTGNITVTAAGSTLSDTVTVAKGGTGATSLTDGGILLGSGTSAVTAMSVLADGGIVVGDGSTDPVALAAFTGSTGTLKHERGGIEADISAIAKGGIVAGSGTGSMAIRTVGTNDQVLTADSSEGTGVKWADAGGGGGTIVIDDTDGTLSVGEAVAIDSNGNAVEISGYAEVYHDLTQMADVTNGIADFRGMQVVPIADGTNRVMRLYSFSGWSNYLVIQVGTWVSATKEMTWGIPLRTDNQTDTFDAYYDSAEDVVVVAYIDGADSQKGKFLVIQPTAGAYNTIVTSTSAPAIAPISSAFDHGNLHTGEHYGLHIAEDAVNDKVIVAFPNADDNSETYLMAFTINPDDGADPHECALYIDETSATTNGTAATGFQMGFAHGKGVLIFNDNGDSEYTHAKGFTIDTSGTPSFTLSSTVEVFGANQKVMMHADIATSRDTPIVNQLSHDSDNDVWLVAGTWQDGDSDYVPVLASFTIGTRTTIGPGGGNTITALDTFNIASGESPLNTPPLGSGHKLTIDTTMSSSAVELTDDYVIADDDFMPTIAYDEDRNCHVMVFIGYGQLYEADMHQYIESNSILRFSTVTTASAGTGIAVRHTGTYMPHMPREGASTSRIDWGHYDFHATDGYSWPRLAYDTSNNVMFHTTAFRYMREDGNNTAHSDQRGIHIGAFHGRTTAAGGGAADDFTRDLVYGTSNMSEFIGFNTAAVSSNDDPATITVSGGLNENQSSLTAGHRYFVGDDGVLRAKLPGMTENLFRAGVTTATTKLLVAGDPMEFT
jgi:hypothetical protein